MLDVVLVVVGLLLVLRSRGADRLMLAPPGARLPLLRRRPTSPSRCSSPQDDFHFGTLLDLGWIVGYALLALAAWYPSVPSADAPDEHRGRPADVRDTALVFAVLLVAAVVQVAVRHPATGSTASTAPRCGWCS